MQNRSAKFVLTGLALLLFGFFTSAAAQDRTPSNQVVWQHVGRFFLNPDTGQARYVGYLVHINGVSGSLFSGAPSEATAHFTFSTDVISVTGHPNNGDIVLYIISAGTFSVYYNPNPSGDWNNLDSFSSGQLVATFQRQESLFPIIGPLGLHSLSERLQSSASFTYNGRTFNFNRIATHGITFAQFFSSTPLTGTTAYPLAFPGAGAVTAMGGFISTVGRSAR